MTHSPAEWAARASSTYAILATMPLTLELAQIRPVAFIGSTDVSGATFTLLREAVANTDFGPGLRELKVSVHLRHKGRPPFATARAGALAKEAPS